ncbi:MAG: dihydroxyacetone kinase subunit L, partial [Rhizobiaceae bacterium]|nr:dihydroxyacetone kinase subunit L [Rhizobiaceae bacterium]
GFVAVRDALAKLDLSTADPTLVQNTAAKSFLNAVGASSGPLYATAFMRAGAAVKGKTTLGVSDTVAMLQAMAKGIQDRGKAEIGEKTMVDAWAPAADAAGNALAAGKNLAQCLDAAAQAADAGAEATKALVAGKGRSSRLGDRAIGHMDPGAASAVVVIEAIRASLS